MILQVIGVVVVLSALAFIVYSLRRYGFDKITLSLILVMVWLLALIAFPFVFRGELNLGFMRPLDAFHTLTAVTALLLSIATYVRLRKTEKDLTKLVQEIALTAKRDQP